MGFVFRMMKNELTSLTTIFLVIIPLLTNPEARTQAQALISSPASIAQSAPLQNVSDLLGGIGSSGFSGLSGALPSLGGGHAPIFIPGSSY